jgi:hypothetical protein
MTYPVESKLIDFDNSAYQRLDKHDSAQSTEFETIRVATQMQKSYKSSAKSKAMQYSIPKFTVKSVAVLVTANLDQQSYAN